MKQLLDKFCSLFPLIEFEVIEREIKAELSVESISTGEKEIRRMLTEAKRSLSKYKKLLKHGKASSEEVFDHEWRVHELEDQLMRFQDDNANLDNDLY
jgi:hypothetical protein